MDETESVEIDLLALFSWILAKPYKRTPKNEVE